MSNLTPRELEALQELVWNVLDSLATDGESDPETVTYSFWKTLHAKIKGSPPMDDTPQISAAPDGASPLEEEQ